MVGNTADMYSAVITIDNNGSLSDWIQMTCIWGGFVVAMYGSSVSMTVNSHCNAILSQEDKCHDQLQII